MISSHHQCVFIHIPKCGGQSVEQAFLDDLGLSWKQRAPLLLKPNPDPAQGPPFLSHLTFREYLDLGYLTPKEMADFFSFALVRNPYHRVVSFYRFLGYDCALPFETFVQRTLPQLLEPGAALHYFVRPQLDFLLNTLGEIGPKAVIRLEDGAAIQACLERFGLKALPHRNRSKDRSGPRRILVRTRYWMKGCFHQSLRIDSRIHWTPELRDTIERLYRVDFESLGYDRGPPPARA